MRGSAFTLAVLVVFSVLGYGIWLDSAIVAEAYRIRQLRAEEADLLNRIRICEARIAAATRPEVLVRAAEEMGQDDLARYVVKSVRLPENREVLTGTVESN